MFRVARHPKNGKEIRVLKSEGCVWRDLKTLAWLDTHSDFSVPWNRFDVGTSSVEAWTAATTAGVSVDICILLGDPVAAREWIFSKNYKTVRMFVVPRRLLEAIGYRTIEALEIPNMLCLENCIELYPIVERQWDSTEDDARVMVSIMLQYKRTLPIVATTPHNSVADVHGLQLVSTASPPPPVYYITQFYTALKADRSKEIAECLKKNVACKYIDHVVLLNEKVYDLPVTSSKIEQHVIGDRLNFKYVFQHILESIPRDSLVVIANSDIYLDNSWRILWSLSMKDVFLSLLRWDVAEEAGEPPKLFGPRDDSQDTWVVDSNSVKDRTWDWTAMDIRFGQNGCDNVVNIEMLKQKFSVVNPCMTLITHHLHNSKYRTYEMADIIYRPAIMYLTPTGIHDLKPEYVLGGVPFEVLREEAYNPKMYGETFEAMLTRKSKEKSLRIEPREVPLFTYENVRQTKDGLIHTYNSILIGRSEAVANKWSETEMSIVAPCVDVDVAFVAFCPDEVAGNPWRYMLEYVGKILYLRGTFGRGEFLGNDTVETKEALQAFSWRKAEVPVLARDADFQAWCRRAHVWYPSGKYKEWVTSTEIAALRGNLVSGWRNVAGRRIVVVADPLWCTDRLIAGLRGLEVVVVTAMMSVTEVMEVLQGALGIVSVSGNSVLYGSWLLSNSSFVFEIQAPAEPSIEIQHLCSTARVGHTIHILPTMRPLVAKDVENLGAAIVRYVEDIIHPPTEAPLKVSNTIVMPSRGVTGFFSHGGDSFREMVQIWNERTYVFVEERKDVQQVWLGGVGEVLLYDRPTMEWLHASKETAWKRALFGNPNPKSAARSTAWSFWPRRPRLVEELALIPRRGFEERERSVVFYGRSENGIQLKNRNKEDWSKVCDEYVHLTSIREKYPYTHEEYLRRLQGARFGLCLAGYGKKCHREIECMAMGCVPIVAPEVDMESYANPPVEGVHYLRVKGAAETAAAVASVSREAWEAMSAAGFAWWEKNASAEGLWKLTLELAYSGCS